MLKPLTLDIPGALDYKLITMSINQSGGPPPPNTIKKGNMKKYIALMLAMVLAACLPGPSAHAAILESNDAAYQKDVVESDLPVILELYATWCSACKKTAPTVDEIASDFDGKVRVVKIDKDKNPVTTALYGVTSIPSFFYVKGGKTMAAVKGGFPKEILLDKLGLGPDGAEKKIDPNRPVEADDRSYEADVINSPLPVVLEFYTTNSEDCKKVEPAVKDISRELAGKARVVKMNKDRSRNTSVLFGVKDVPAFFYLVKGEMKGTAAGAHTKDELMDKLGLVPDPPAKPASGAKPLEADDSSYDALVVRPDTPVLIQFYAAWCGACKKSAPTVDEIARELDGKIKVVKMNVDKSRKVSEKFKVTSIPMFVYMKDGKVVGTATGAYPKDELLKMLGIEPDKM